MKNNKMNSVIGMILLALATSVAARDLTSGDLVRRQVRTIESKLKAAGVTNFNAVLVEEFGDSEVQVSITIGSSDVDPYQVRVMLKGVTPENISSKVDEAVAVIVLDLEERYQGADARLTQLSFGMSSSSSRTNELRREGFGVESHNFMGGVSVWAVLPAVSRDRASQSRWGRVTLNFGANGLSRWSDSDTVNMVAKANISVYESQGQWTNPEAGVGLAGLIRILDVEPAGRVHAPTNEYMGRVELGIIQLQGESLTQFEQLPQLELFISAGMRIGVRVLGDMAHHENLRVALIFDKKYFVEGAGNMNANGPGLSNVMELAIGTNFWTDAGFPSSLKGGIRYKSGYSDPYYVAPEGVSFFFGSQFSF